MNVDAFEKEEIEKFYINHKRKGRKKYLGNLSVD